MNFVFCSYPSFSAAGATCKEQWSPAVELRVRNTWIFDSFSSFFGLEVFVEVNVLLSSATADLPSPPAALR